MKKEIREQGIILVEIVIGAAIIASSFVAIIGVYATLTKFSYQSIPRMQATMLAEGGIEAVRSMRDQSYSKNLESLSNGSPYYISYSSASSTYSAIASPSLIDNTFNRTFTVSPAYRDSNFNLASTGTLDPNTKLVTVNVSWLQGNSTSTYTLESYLSDIFNN